MPKAPLKAQIFIGLFAVLAIAYGLAIVRLDDGSLGKRNAVPGQLIVVNIGVPSSSMTSSDPWVVAPISVSLSPKTRAYFIALKPGHATLRAILPNPCNGCLSRTRLWSVEVTVWPG